MSPLAFLKKYNIPLILLFAAVSLAVFTAWIGFFVSDDAFISFRYARNLARSGELVFNSGEKVEGYTNFLWTLTLSFFSLLRIRLEIIVHFLTFISAVAVLAAAGKILKDSFSVSVPLVILAVFSCLFNGTFAFWTTGGLEGMAFTAFFLWGVYLTFELPSSRRWVLLYFLTWSGCILTRPEGIMLAGISGFFVFFQSILRKYKDSIPYFNNVFIAGSLLVSAFIVHSLFRFFYYGSLIPNTWYTKVYGIPPDFLIKHGINYVKSFFSYYWLFAFLPLIAAVFIKPERITRAILLIVLSLSLTIHIVLSGGDFMAMHRMMLPIWPILIILLFSSLNEAHIFLQKHFRYTFIVTGAIAILFATVQLTQSLKILSKSKKSEKTWFGMESVAGMKNFVSDRVIAGKRFKSLLGPEGHTVKIAVGGAGALSYFSEGKIIDSFGLMDPVTAKKKVIPGKFYKPGHLKQASWSYIAKLSPQIICTPGIATMGMGPPSLKHRRRIQTYWKNYAYFCIRGNYSRDDRGRPRNSYCCLIQNDFRKDIVRVK
ncbi:hypothetical protein KKF34_03200 [Myxococcota bacterium]|nr:hypothetical protein [Myxococcota bacterium]MBU1382647.1 hypothetical protein [Myxococcota bacterium]MBU1495864.1 hypothetical protein [Myxococcota bacterium]